MKARLLHRQDSLQLLVCNGKILDVSLYDAYRFLSNYDDPGYYAGPGTWDYDNLTMESFSGSTIAIVNDDNSLTISDPEWYRKILVSIADNLLTAQEYAKLHGKKSAIIRRFCLSGRLPGAVFIGNSWFIPRDTPYPAVERVRD